MRMLLALGWFGVVVAALSGVLLYFAGGMYVGLFLVMLAAAGMAGLVAAHFART